MVNFPTVQLDDDAHGNKSVLIRVDSMHVVAALAMADYTEVTLDNQRETCFGRDYIVYQAGARSTGMVIQAEIGLCRGIYNMQPPAA
eukprot:10982032-Heterocapsa_arctica.AAC.1